MNEFNFFITTALVLMGLVIIFFWAALKSSIYKARSQPHSVKEAMMANVTVYREQLTELAAEFELGRMNEAEFEAAREELAQRLMEDSQPPPPHSQGAQTFKGASAFTPNDSASLASQKILTPWIRWTMPALTILIPAISIAIYIVIGSPGAMDFVDTQDTLADEAFTPEKLSQMAVELNQRLAQEPNNADGWVMLARVEPSLSHFESAEKALTKSLSLSDNQDVQIERAEVLAQINHGSFKGEPWGIILKILKANPDQGNALLLAGSAAFSENRYSDALKYWQRVQAIVAPNSPDGIALAEAISKAQDRAGIKHAPPAPSLAGPAPPLPPSPSTASGADTSMAKNNPKSSANSANLMGRVLASSSLATKIHPTDTVFIYATAVSGSRMPLAMIKTSVDKLPFDFVLNDSNAMNPSAVLSSVTEVLVKARISVSGNAMPQPGDFGVTIGPVKVDTKNINLTISEPIK